MSRILCVEDDEHLAAGLAFNLRNSGYDVDLASSGEDALAATREHDFDLVLLDVMLPGIDGFEVVRELRKAGQRLPVLMITAKSQAGEVIGGLDAGADDYITKPFDLDEVLARIRVLLRREVWNRVPSQKSESTQDARYGKWLLDFRRLSASDPDGALVELTAKEAAMLKLFTLRPHEVISRETFLEEVWGVSRRIETRTVDNFVSKIRQLLEEDPSSPEHIQSVRGAGYRFVP